MEQSFVSRSAEKINNILTDGRQQFCRASKALNNRKQQIDCVKNVAPTD